MPTFVLAEWGYRAGCLVALFHACCTDRKKSWAAAIICGKNHLYPVVRRIICLP